MAFTFQRAQREQIKIKIAIAGPAGSGKSEGALAVARQLVGPNGRIAALDTENRALSLYADRYAFDVIDLAPPYETRFFADALDAAVGAGYDALVIDSLSHQWEGEGGILDRKQKKESALGGRANGFALWNEFKGEHREFIARLVNAPIHVIACFRAREEHVQTEKDGRKSIEKLGMAPITGEGAEYEFRVVFALTMTHVALTSKDNTGLFDGRFTNLLKDDPGGRLAAWLAEGVPTTLRPAQNTSGNGAGRSQMPTSSANTLASESGASSSFVETSAPRSTNAPRVANGVIEQEAACPKCGGAMWDNRATKTNPKAPDYKCKRARDKDDPCEGVWWPGQWPPVSEEQKAADKAAELQSATEKRKARGFPQNFPVKALRGRLVGGVTREELVDALEASRDADSPKWVDLLSDELEERNLAAQTELAVSGAVSMPAAGLVGAALAPNDLPNALRDDDSDDLPF